MRIGIFYKHYEGEGGFPREFQRFVCELAALGEEVTVYTYKGKKPTISPNGVIVKSFAGRERSSFRLPTALVETLTKDSTELDILEIVGAYFPENITVSRLARRLKLPYVLAPLGVFAPKIIKHSNRLLKLCFIYLFERNAMRHAIGLHCFSRIEKEWIHRIIVRPIIQTTLGSFIEDVPEHLDRKYLRRKLNLTDKHTILLFLGRFDLFWKGLPALVDGFSLIHNSYPEARLVLIGPDQDGNRQQLQKQIDKAGLENKIYILDPIYGPNKFNAQASADLFVAPSNTDIVPRAVREALTVGTPALVSDESQAGEIVEAYEAGRRCFVNAHDIARKIDELISERDQLASMRKNAKKAAVEGLNWRNQALALRDGYLRLLKDARISSTS